MIALFVLVAFLPLDALACACCAENGQYNISTETPDKARIAMVEEIKFSSAAELFLFSEFDVKGLDSIKAEYEANDWATTPDFFSLDNVFAAKTWKLNFKTKGGKTGTLNLPMPKQMVRFAVDIHDGKTAGAGGPSLYKEWRFKGAVKSGNGFFASGIAPMTSYFLVLQGRGNNCDNAEDFKNWRLEINGKKADYAFFGKLE